jgi:hypothetical protein
VQNLKASLKPKFGIDHFLGDQIKRIKLNHQFKTYLKRFQAKVNLLFQGFDNHRLRQLLHSNFNVAIRKA